MQQPPRPGYGPPLAPLSTPYGAPPYQAMPGHPGGLPYPRPYGAPPHGGSRPPPPQQLGGSPAKSTTLWVGKIAPTVEARLIYKLLEACGPLKEWKPATDPASGAIKGFGFATYQEPEGVLVALAVLNGLSLDGLELALKCNSATEQYINWFKSSRVSNLQGSIEEAQVTAEAKAREEVATLASGRTSMANNNNINDSAAAANEFLSSFGQGQIQETPHIEPKREIREATERKRPRDDRPSAGHEPRKKPDYGDKQRQEDARKYKELLWEWEMHEREKERKFEKRADRESDLRTERQRQLLADNEGYESDDDREPWERKPYFGSRRAADRRRRREQEKVDEEADEQRELEGIKTEEERQRKEKEAAEAAAAAALAAEKARLEAEAEKAQQEQASGVEALELADAAKAKMRARIPRAGAAAFGEDEKEEEAHPARKLIPLQYTAEELGAAAAENEGNPEQQQKVSHQAPQTSAAPDDIKKKLMASIPKDQEGVFAYPLKWEQLDTAGTDVKERVSGWISKKIADLLGEEEPSFCEFIMTQVNAHDSATQMLSNLRDVLDEDADVFVMKLFQVLIYETERLAAASAK